MNRPSAALLRTALLATAVAVALALAPATSTPAEARAQGPYTLEILVGGRPLPELAGRGRTYVEALAGREYSIRLSNQTGRRVAIALAVDGLSSIDARTSTASDATKWILGPYETLTLDGWQTSSHQARRFFFTTESASYGAWLGKTENLGVISAVVFRERVRPPLPRLSERREKSPGSMLEKAEPGEPAPAAGGALQRADDLAATGIGREVEHQVERIAFDAEPAAAANLEIRYEYRDALIKLGLLPQPPRCETPLDRRERARGFAEPGFAPDPYRQPQREP